MTNEIEKLTEFQHCRLRTEMYLASRDLHTQTIIDYENNKPIAKENTWVPALFTAFREIMDNALDEIVTHGHGDTLKVTYDENNLKFSVSDNGRGIPITFSDKFNTYMATMALTETKAGRNFSDDRGATRGLNGVGASVVNFCSEYFEVTIKRDKKSFNQRFTEGDGTNADLIIEDAIIFSDKNTETGTKIDFKLSGKVFHTKVLPESFIRARLLEIALIYPTLKIYFNGEKINGKGGVTKVLFGDTKPIIIEINREGFNSTFWLVPRFFEDGSEYSHSLVNAIPVFNGGTHIEALKKNFFSGMLTALEKESKKRKLNPNKSDMDSGLLTYSVVEMDNPSFDSQSKTRLINENVGKIIRDELNGEDFYKSVIRKNPEWIEAIYQKCADRTFKKDLADTNKLAKKVLRCKVADLSDASYPDRSKCILFLTEGLSSVGLLLSKRKEIHGALPLRGKILNIHPSHGVTTKTILDNEALTKILQSIGLVPGQKAERKNLRYGKVYITCDADFDGASITSLLTLFFFKLFPELFNENEEPFIYMLDTPLIVVVKGKTRYYWYSDNYHEFNSDDWKGCEITRAKGLAALVGEDWERILAEPKLIPLIYDDKLDDTLNLIFDKNLTHERKIWLGL